MLLRPRFKLPAGEVELVLNAIRSRAWSVEPTRHAKGLTDVDDAPFLQCAWAADLPLVTGNARHFPRLAVKHATILTPAMFVAAAAK
ncbi:MAG: hypothetical protein HKL96_10490 [Phycisphaerales bacterium]|nr:hypothetical protein [Phycisphaerales bacterium]